MKKILAAILLSVSVLVPAAASGACGDPVSGNAPLVWRSLSGVEVDWHFSVPAGCSGSFKLVVYRSGGTALDPKSARHYSSPKLTLGSGEWTLNALITKPGPAHAVFFVNGAIYRILPIDPGSV